MWGDFLDIILNRILSLIPKNENGKFKHGSLSKFARELGFKDGHIISDWMAENSTSYMNYLYQISAIYGVSVEWLRGETDEKSPSPNVEDGQEAELISLFRSLAPDQQQRQLDFLRDIVGHSDK